MINLDENTAEKFDVIEFVDTIDTANEFELTDLFRTYDGPAKTAPESHHGIRQLASHPYPAEYIELLFDATTPEATDEDLVLRSLFAPADMPQALRPITQAVVSCSPTPQLLDTSDLKLQPIPAVQSFWDHVSQMLDSDPVNDIESQEPVSTAYIPIRPGRSLVHPPPLCSDPATDAPSSAIQETLLTLEERGQGNLMATTADDPLGKRPCASEAEYDRVLGHITGRDFLPGLEHLTNIEVQSAFTTYSNDTQAPHQATEMFIENRHGGECNCLDDSSGKVDTFVRPGENFLFSENDDALGLSVGRPMAQSILDLIDELVDADNWYVDVDMLIGLDTICDHRSTLGTHRLGPVFAADIQRVATSSPPGRFGKHEEGAVDEVTPHLGAFFDVNQQNIVTYTALGELLKSIDNSPYQCHVYTNTNDHVSEMSDNEGDSFPMTQPSKLTYFDADTQQFCAYIAFNQLLDVAEDEMLPRIHRDYDDYCDIDSDAGVLEIIEPTPSRNMASSSLRVTNETALDSLEIHVDLSPLGLMPQPTLTWSDIVQPATLHSGKFKRGRPRLTLKTQLEPIPEEGSATSLSSPSSADSLDFELHRDYVKPLSSRRMNFLEEEDDEVGVVESTHPAHYLDASDTIQTSPIPIVVENIDDLFSGDIWYVTPALTLDLPSRLPVSTALLLKDSFSDPGLKVLEIEIRDLLGVMVECVNDLGRAARP